MPLQQSNSRKAISSNIATEMHHGKPAKQAQAIAIDVAKKHGGYPVRHAAGDDLSGGFTRPPGRQPGYGRGNFANHPNAGKSGPPRLSPGHSADMAHSKAGGEDFPAPIGSLHRQLKSRPIQNEAVEEYNQNAYEARYGSNTTYPDYTQREPSSRESFDLKTGKQYAADSEPGACPKCGTDMKQTGHLPCKWFCPKCGHCEKGPSADQSKGEDPHAVTYDEQQQDQPQQPPDEPKAHEKPPWIGQSGRQFGERRRSVQGGRSAYWKRRNAERRGDDTTRESASGYEARYGSNNYDESKPTWERSGKQNHLVDIVQQ